MAGVRALRVGSRSVDFTGKIPARINDCLLVDASAGALTVSLPNASIGLESVVVKKIDSSANAVTVERRGTDTIDGATTYVLTAQFDAVEVVPAQGKWHITGRKVATIPATALDVTSAAATTDVVTLDVTGDTQNRFVVNADGKLEWGSGSAAADVSVERSGTRELLVDNLGMLRSRNGAGEFWTTLLKLESRGYGTSLIFNQGGNSQMQASGGLGITGPNGSTHAALFGTNGSMGAGPGSALATNATGGFMFLPQMAGTPSGTPSTTEMGTGRVPVVIDTSASKLWAYIGGAWKSVTLA